MIYSPRPASCADGSLVIGEGLIENVMLSIAIGGLWHLLNKTIPRMTLPKLSEEYTKQSEELRTMWDVKFINTLFTFVIVPMVYYCLNVDTALQQSPINGTSFVVRLTAATAVGFFI